MNKPIPKPDDDSILHDAWGRVVGCMTWLQAVFFGEFADHRPLSALIADMLLSFMPGVVIVTSARDAVAIVLRLACHPEKREELLEWVLLCSCLIVIALPIAMAASGALAAGAGAAVGGIVGSELAAALRAVMLLMIRKSSTLVELVLFLQKFIKGDVLKLLRAVKFITYEKVLLQALNKIIGKLRGIVGSLRAHLEGLGYFQSVKVMIARLTEWEGRFYSLQQDALRQIPRALGELDARLAKVLVETLPKETHTITGGVQASKSVAVSPEKQRIKDVAGRILVKKEDEAQVAGTPLKGSVIESKASTPRGSQSDPSLKDRPEHSNSPTQGANTKKQSADSATALAHQEKAEKLVEKIGEDIKNHPLRKAYEAEVADLKIETQAMVKANSDRETIARKMWMRRREIGVKYKNLTPTPLRDYIYELNSKRYSDPLGPSFDSLVKQAQGKMQEPYEKIIDSSTRQNGDVNSLLSKFKDWLIEKDPDYLDRAMKDDLS